MDFLNRAYSQLSDLYRSMTPGSRLTAGLLAMVLVLSAGYMFTHQVATPDVDLMHGVPVAAGDLPRMEAAFAKANLKGYEVRGTSIRVPRGQEAQYMAALADAKALPPNFGDALREAISAGNPLEFSRQREQRIRIGTQETLALIIGTMPGIERAYVLYDVDYKPGFNRDKLTTATACIKPTGSTQLDEARVSAIRYLVAGAIAGLKPENVTVSDLNGRAWHGSAEESAGAEENRYLSLQRACEQDLKAKILNALCFIPNVTVEPSVVLDREHIAHLEKNRGLSAAERRVNGDPASARAKDHHGDRPGVSAQQPNTATILGNLLGGARSEDDGREPEANEAVSPERTEKESVGFAPIRAKVSVGVPISYFKKVWQERNPVAPGQPLRTPDQAALDQVRNEESAKIQRHVAQLLPQAESLAKAAELVTVTTFQDIPLQEPPAPDFSQVVLLWLRQSWQTLGMIALALIGLMMLRSIVRSAPAAPSQPSSAATSQRLDQVSGDEPASVPPPHGRRFRQPAAPLHDELSGLVEEDPDAAAHVLRNWIGQVS